MSWKKYLDYDFENDIDADERKAQDEAVDEDLVKVREIVESCDMKSSKEVTRIYLLVKEYKITFKTTKVRNDFLNYLAETAAVNRAAEAERNAKLNKKSNVQRIVYTTVGVILIIAAAALLVYNINSRNNQIEQQDTMTDIQQLHNSRTTRQEQTTEAETDGEAGTDTDVDGDGEPTESESTEATESAEPVMNAELVDIYNINSDLAGWLTIPGTGLDYPVLKASDNDYYLTRNVYRENSKMGSIYMDYRNEYDDINIIIYGHNMSDGSMFGYLNSYKNESFYKNHKEIYFDTLYEHHTYEVIAVCQGRVRYVDEEGFRYYNYTDDEYELDSFFMDMRNQSLYTVEHEFTNDDRFITLSTCSNTTETGRLYLVAVLKE